MLSESTTFPVIDVSKIDDPSHQLSIAKEITSACSQWGFLLLKGHSIPSFSIQKLFKLNKDFSSLPDTEKDPYRITSSQTGYIGSFRDSKKDDKQSMWFGGRPGTLAANKTALPPFWRRYTEEIEAFKHQCHDLILKLLECFALALDLPDRDFFTRAHAEDAGHGNALRLIMYPARSSQPNTGGSRMQPHTDSGSVTLLFQQSPGLEVLSPTGEWVKAPCLEDHILVNLGDALSYWSGLQLKATLHRVTFEGLPFDRERQSMAYFGKAQPATVLQPLRVGQEVRGYRSNGVELRPGITVGELSDITMRDIYGGSGTGEGTTIAVAT